MSELRMTEHNEAKEPTDIARQEIKPQTSMTADQAKDFWNKKFNLPKESTISENSDGKDIKLYTSREERITKAEESKGEWSGNPGDSVFIPDKQEARDALQKYNQAGIEYRDGNPDFSKVSEISLKIDDMTSSRPRNFAQADMKCAEAWNASAREGRTDWTAREVKEWRSENRYSWHERVDRSTMDLVQRDLHEECKHFGGVAECKRAEAENGYGGGFDD